MRIPAHRLLFLPLGREKLHAWCSSTERTIALDPRSTNLLHSYVHELLHLRFPSWTEAKVIRETRREWKKLTWRDKAKLAQALGKGRVGQDE